MECVVDKNVDVAPLCNKYTQKYHEYLDGYTSGDGHK